MGKKRMPGKPFSPGNEVENKTVIKVVDTGTKVIHWRYLVISGCCGTEQVLSHDALRRIESNEQGTMCRGCMSKDKIINDKRRRRQLEIKRIMDRPPPPEGSDEWAHNLMSGAGR